jgi:sigma-B regulation protein RsbU (phosphoserine phosphatase)
LDAEIERLVPGVTADSTLYVADEGLRVVYTNEEWRRFAQDNQGAELTGPAWNTHLLENMSGRERERWASIYDLLLSGELSHYEEDFICSSPDERRIYRLRSTPVRRDDGSTLLVHHTVRIDDKPEEREGMRSRLRSLDDDPEQVQHEYRRRVLERSVSVPGFRVAQFLRPLEDVGGDVLWHRTYEDGTTDVVLADAMGHGPEASVHATKLVMMLDSLTASYRQPQDVLAALNRGLLRHRAEHESAFASGILFRFRRGSPRVRCANFGHTPPVFSRSGEVELDVGLALGIVDTLPVWPEVELDMTEHGTRFMAFSDGITEQFDAQGEMYGTQRMTGIFQESESLDLDAAVRAILDDLGDFRGHALVKDDRTLIAFELQP